MLRAQLELARALRLPVIFHDREAHGDSLAIVREFPDVTGVFHCFSGSPEMARELLQMGWYLGFDGPVTYKNARRAPEVAAVTPPERMLIETDSPYMTPVPYRGQRNSSAYVYLVAEKLAAWKGVTPEELEKVLPISRLRIDAAEKVLQDLDLLPRPARQAPPDPADERPVYTAQDIAGLLTDNEGFRLLVPQTEQQLGKKLRTADLQILAGLYDDLGMPADVIYLLVCHCVERARSQWGEGRRPTMRQVEKEGYRWAQLGIFDQNSAAVYLRKWAERNRKYTSYLSNLRILNRPPVEAERRYIDQWMDMGFPPETVALAYERTVFYKKDLNWRYLNAVSYTHLTLPTTSRV